LSGLSFLLVSFSPLNQDDIISRETPAPPSGFLTEEHLLQINPIRAEASDVFVTSWNKEALWPGLMDREGKATSGVDTLATSFSDLDYLMEDPFNRLEGEFKIPHSLKDRVRFWLQVFGRVTSKGKIIHDKRKPEIIYGYLNFQPLYKEAPSSATAAIRAAHAEKSSLKTLALMMKEAAGLTRTRLLTDEGRSELRDLIERAGGGLDEKSVNRAIKNLRTQTGQNDHFIEGLRRSQLLLPQIEAIFKDKGLPIGLTRIPFVESSFNPKAYSKIGALGLWQFVRETARHMIHPTSEQLWRNPLEQSKAAAKLLKTYRGVLPDWGITITAYNSGVGRMRRLTRKYGLDSVSDFDSIPIKEDFGFAGRNFFVEVLAVNLLEQYKDALFPEALNPEEPFLVFKGVNLPEWSRDQSPLEPHEILEQFLIDSSIPADTGLD